MGSAGASSPSAASHAHPPQVLNLLSHLEQETLILLS